VPGLKPACQAANKALESQLPNAPPPQKKKKKRKETKTPAPTISQG